MDTPTYVSLSRQMSLMKEMERVANNLANMNTTGYRAEYGLFEEYIASTGKIGHRQLVSYTQDIGQYRASDEGSLQLTGEPLDLALKGDGFFTIGNPEGNMYARTGKFQLDQEGRVVNYNGFPVLLEGGQPLRVDNAMGPVTISSNGSVLQANQILGKLAVVNFGNESSLRRSVNGFYITDQPPLPATGATIVQGALEGSNVKSILEISRMLQISRQYEATNRMIENENTRKQTSNQRLSSTS